MCSKAFPEHGGSSPSPHENLRIAADRLRRSIRDVGALPVIPGRRNRKHTICYDKQRYRARHLIENAFCRLEDFRRVATRYDKLAANFLSGVALATAVAFWL